MNIGRFCLLLGPAILIFAPATSRGITLGQVDTFEATTANWLGGAGVQNKSGGPAGPSDHYLSFVFVQGDSNPSDYLPLRNFNQWSGNYISAGVTGIEMDLINPSTVNVPIRLEIALQVIPDSPAYDSTTAFNLPADGQWHHAVFSLTADSMTGNPSASIFSFADFSSNVSILRIIGSGPSGFGVDNVHAIPEPASISILLSGIVGIALLRRNRARY